MNDKIKDIKDEIIELFNSKDNDYKHSDRLYVALHEILDNYVTYAELEEILEELKNYDSSDFETLDSGMYDGVLEEKGFIGLCEVLLYLLIEQELFNDEDFNALQNVEVVNGITLV